MIKYVPYESTTLNYLYLAPFSYTSFFLYRSFSIKGARFFFFVFYRLLFFFVGQVLHACVCFHFIHHCVFFLSRCRIIESIKCSTKYKRKINKILKFLPSVFLPSDASFVFDAFVYFSFSRESLILVANTVNALIFLLMLKIKIKRLSPLLKGIEQTYVKKTYLLKHNLFKD